VNFLSTFLDWTATAESPYSFFLWGGLSAISAVMRDNIYHQWEHDKLYPNMFILLLGPPAIGKRLPMVKAGGLIKKVKNTRVIEGSASMQAVIKSLGEYETGGLKGASCILYAEEFTAFHVKDSNTNELLTDLWDYHETWERNLISWSASLKNVCLSLFTASNEVLIKPVLDARAMFGGLVSRTIIVIEHRKRHKDAYIRRNGHNPPNLQEVDPEIVLLEHLKNLSKLKGEIIFEEDAMREFEVWYHTQWDEDSPETKTGVEGRMKTHIKKVAMLLAMCESELELIVRKRHIEYAIELCVKLYVNYKILSSESGENPNAHSAALLLRLLALAPEQTLARKIILRRNLGEFNPELLDSCVKQLVESELAVEVNANNTIYYRLTAKAIDWYHRELERKSKEKGATTT